MLCHQKGKVGSFRAKIRTVIAVAVDGNNTVGVLIYHHAVRIHTEGSYIVLKSFRPIHDLALIEFVRQMRKNDGWKFHPDTDIQPVGFGGNGKVTADLLHPLTSAPSHRHNTSAAVIGFVLCQNTVAILCHLNLFHRRIEKEVHVFLHLVVQILQNHVVDVCPQMAHRSIQQFQLILHAELLERSSGSGIHFRSLATVGHIDAVHIFHQFKSPFSSDVLIEGAAKIVGDIVFSIGKSSRPAKSVHDGAGLTLDTAFDLISVNGTMALLQRMSPIKYSNF